MDSVHWAKIKWEFSEGAYGNFPGSVHFLEHFINKKARPIAHENSLDIKAWTSQLEVGEVISGVANPNVMNYGIWPVLKEIRTALESPLTTVPDIEKSIETEKEVIKAEIKHMTSDHEFQIGKHSRQVIYSQDNPLVDNPTVTGTEVKESLA